MKKLPVRLLITAALLLAVSCLLFADGGDPEKDKQPPVVGKAAGSIKIDGILDDAAWESAMHMTLDYEVRPGENTEPKVSTEIFLTYSKTHLYVAFICEDPEPKNIRARYKDRDSAYSDDFVGIIIDTFNDQRRAYEFFVNPFGVQMDLIQDDVSGSEDDSWNAIWDSAGVINEKGYVVEFSIPFTQIRFQDGDGMQTWGFDAVRIRPRADRTQISINKRDRNKNSYLTQLMKIQGFEGVERGKNIEIVPTITAQRSDTREDIPDGELADDSEGDLGLTARWGITPNITLNGTLNPDFSQVEADSVRLDINETFTIFFPETRPFFLDGADYFSTQRIDLLHTRTVVDPDYAVKTTGKAGRHTFGVFTAHDTQTSVILPGSQGSDGETFNFETDDTVARYRMDFGGNSTIGGMLTDRRGNGYNSTAVSVDSRYRLTDNDQFIVNLAGSTTTYNDEMVDTFELDKSEFSGHALSAYYEHSTRGGWFNASYADFSPEFRADLGFVTQVDYRKFIVGGGRDWWGESTDFFRRLTLQGDYDQTEEQDGSLIERELEVYVQGQGPMQSWFLFGGGGRQRVYDDVRFDQMFYTANLEFRPLRDMFLGTWINWGDWIDFEHTRPADRFNYETSIQYHFGSHLYTSLSYDYSILNVEPGRLFTAHVPQLRVVYQINNRAFVRAILQYVNITRDPELYVDDVDKTTKDLATQLLFSYKINPQTVLYVGYSDSYEGTQEYSLTQAKRTFFLKIGYAWLK